MDKHNDIMVKRYTERTNKVRRQCEDDKTEIREKMNDEKERNYRDREIAEEWQLGQGALIKGESYQVSKAGIRINGIRAQ